MRNNLYIKMNLFRFGYTNCKCYLGVNYTLRLGKE